MTTRRRLRPIAPWRGRTGRFGRFDPLDIGLSVEPREPRIDPHRLSKGPIERAPAHRAFEAGEPAARVRAPPHPVTRGCQDAVRRDEADELRLPRLAATAGARPDRE